MTVIKHWHRLSKEVVVIVFGETQNSAGHGPEQPGPADPALSSRFGLDDLQGYLPASTVLSFEGLPLGIG